MAEDGRTIGRAAGSQYRKITRRKDLLWDVDLQDKVYGQTAVIDIGTMKYETCDMIWDLEHLRGTDGFGNPLPEKNQ